MSTAASALATSSRQPRALHFTLWGAQILLALVFASAGGSKVSLPYAALSQQMGQNPMPEALIRFIGISELLGALGVILPAATRIKPGLTVLAAFGLAMVMVLASLYHIMIGALATLPVPLALGALAAFVTWARWKKAPIAPR